MAKKGGAIKVQEEINNDEDLEKFLERPGLCVLDIYSEWCGPCLGMLGALKKIKLEVDNLSLAICNSENITAFRRFRRKSEPTWLFVVDGRAVNIMFGSDTPKLMSLITREIQDLGSKKKIFYQLDEYQPEEEVIRRMKEEVIAEQQRKQFEKREKKRLEYLMHVTDVIMENLPDVGVTLFGPQVHREMFKKISEPAELLKIQCKDRKFVEVLKEHFETINFKCPNPIEEDVLEQLHGKELLLCFWRVPGDGKDVPRLLNQYAASLQKPPTDEFTAEEFDTAPILSPMDVKIEIELEEGEVWIEEEPSFTEEAPEEDKRDMEPEMDEDLEEEEEAAQTAEDAQMDANAMQMPLAIPGLELDLGIEEEDPEEEQIVVEEEPKKKTRIKRVRIPPIWVPNNHRTHAALIYVYFHNNTKGFLPPDPVPQPPHVIMAFDTYKRKDIISQAERYKADIPFYGFFTSDNVDEAKYITNSLEKYKMQTENDKIILKVNKATSHTMLSLVSYGPSYVSPNTNVGYEEAKKIFPKTYMTAEQEKEELAKQELAASELKK